MVGILKKWVEEINKEENDITRCSCGCKKSELPVVNWAITRYNDLESILAI